MANFKDILTRWQSLDINIFGSFWKSIKFTLHVDIFVIKNLQFFLLHQNRVRVYFTKLLRSLLLVLSPLFQPYKPYDVQWLQSKFSSKFQYMGHENLSKWSQMGRFFNLWSTFSNYMLKRNVGRICAVSSGLKGMSCIGMIIRWKNNCTYVFFVTINLTSHSKVWLIRWSEVVRRLSSHLRLSGK